MTRAFTTFAAGPNAAAAHAAKAGEVGATTRAVELPVPDGANPSKLATWVQRVAQDPAAAGEVPEDVRSMVEEAASSLADRDVCLALQMSGDIADRMRARVGAGPDDAVWLLFGLTD